MSTRANIIIRDAENHRLSVYHHYDGYLKGVGRKLEHILQSIPKDENNALPEAFRTLQGLAEYLHSQDDLFKPGVEVADPDYRYEIDLSTRKVEWFHVNSCTGDVLDQGFLCEF